MRFLLLSMFFLLAPQFAAAASVSITSEPVEVGAGDQVAVRFYVDSRTQLNTFSGTITHSANLVPIAVSDANSVISLWLQKPTETPLAFAGFTPGGFTGEHGLVFTVIFRATSPGTGQVALENLELLRNDGQGTKESATSLPYRFRILAESTNGYQEDADTTPPEVFAPQVGKDEALFEGDWYVAFTTQDKGSGMDQYFVAETRLPFFRPKGEMATSPYPLRDQYRTSDIVVHAYDRAGNVRTAVFHRQHLLRPYEFIILGGILIAALWLLYTKRRAR